jgi:hypothetical protein
VTQGSAAAAPRRQGGARTTRALHPRRPLHQPRHARGVILRRREVHHRAITLLALASFLRRLHLRDPLPILFSAPASWRHQRLPQPTLGSCCGGLRWRWRGQRTQGARHHAQTGAPLDWLVLQFKGAQVSTHLRYELPLTFKKLVYGHVRRCGLNAQWTSPLLAQSL